MSVVPPVLSCTQAEQKWHKPQTMGVKPGPVDAMVVLKPKPGVTTASGVGSTLYKSYGGELPHPATLNPGPAYAGMTAESLPLICTMNISADKPLVDSLFGKVQAGSVLSYQQPIPPSDSVVMHEDAPPLPSVPLEGYRLNPTECSFVPTHQEQLHLSSLSVTLPQSHLIEEATRCQSATPDWHSLRKERVTASHFREVSHVRGPGTTESLAERIIRGTRQTAHMKRGMAMEKGALKDYAVLKNLNLTKCGLVVHPDASWLDAHLVVLVKEEVTEEQSADVYQRDPEHLHIKKEEEELWTSLEGEQLNLKEETGAAGFPFTAVSIKIENDEEKPLFSHLQQQIEDTDVPTSSSACLMKAKTGGAEISSHPDMNPHEQTSDSSETEVSEDDKEEDDLNLDSELSDSGDGDNDWKENVSSESEVKTVNKSFSCPECGEQFLHKQSLKEHVRLTSHSAMRSSGFLRNTKCVKQHVDSFRKVQTELKFFMCDDCGKRFNKKSNLNSHMSIHTGQKPFACDLCGQTFRLKAYLNSHMSVHTGQKPFACEFCGQTFRRKEHLNTHVIVHTGEKPFSCELCEQRFTRKEYLHKHIKAHTGQKPFACEVCGKRLSQENIINGHMCVHTGQKLFACKVCGKRLSQESIINGHMCVLTGQKPFACEICGQRFSQKKHLNSHIRDHTGHKQFACEICGQRFSQKEHLNSHIRDHTGQKPFACEICGQRFCQKKYLNSHIKIHTGEKPFACEICGRRFSQKSNLNSHIKVHTGEKPFACELCGQRFSRKERLNSHITVHTGQMPFACEVCGQRFNRKERLNSHIRIHAEQKA